jgi:hypothetical protein
MAVDMKAIEKESARYQKVISKKSTQWLRDMVKYHGISLKSPWAQKKSLIIALVDFHRADEIRREQEAEERDVIHTLSFKTKWSRGRFANKFLKDSGIEFEKENEMPENIYGEEFSEEEEFNIVIKGKLSAEIRQQFAKTTSAISIVSILVD